MNLPQSLIFYFNFYFESTKKKFKFLIFIFLCDIAGRSWPLRVHLERDFSGRSMSSASCDSVDKGRDAFLHELAGRGAS